MYKVYWIHKSHYTDPKTQGYVGYTERSLEERYSEHSNPKNDSVVGKILRNKTLGVDVFISEIFVSKNRQAALDYEFELRPEWDIAWNGSPGGWKGGVKPGRKTGWKQSKETKEKHRQASLGNKNGKNKAVETEVEGIVFRSQHEAAEYLSNKYGYCTAVAVDKIKNKKPFDKIYTGTGTQNSRARKVTVDGLTFDLKKHAILYLTEKYPIGKNKAIEHIDKGTPLELLLIKQKCGAKPKK